MTHPLMLKKLKLHVVEDQQDLLELTPKKVHFHHRERNARVGNQEILGVTGKFGLGVQTEAG